MNGFIDQIGNFADALDQFGQNYLSLFVEQDTWIFIILTCILGGGAAFAAGRSLALGWRPYYLLFIYMLIFTCGIRFLHFGLFQSELLSVKYYISHGLVIQLSALLGYRMTMARQMAEKYPFAFERAGLLSWRAKS
jgi:hypothetical protein